MKTRCKSAGAMRKKNRFWRAVMSHEAGEHENFFIAKNRDSESAKRALQRHLRSATTCLTPRSNDALMIETIAAQSFPAFCASVDAMFSRTVRVAAKIRCSVVDHCAS